MGFLTAIYLGAFVGLVIGVTGMGSGSLLTPLLILVGQLSPAAAVGTSVTVAFGTKLFGSWSFHQRGMIQTKILTEVSIAAIPGAVMGALLIRYLNVHRPEQLQHFLLRAIGLALILVSFAMIVRLLPSRGRIKRRAFILHPALRRALIVSGAFGIGFVFSLTSVGSGAALVPLLIFCYDGVEPGELVGTAIAISTILSGIAGLAHAEVHTVDWRMAAGLLTGALPAIWLASHMHARLPRQLPQGLMATTLMAIGVRIILS